MSDRVKINNLKQTNKKHKIRGYIGLQISTKFLYIFSFIIHLKKTLKETRNKKKHIQFYFNILA